MWQTSLDSKHCKKYSYVSATYNVPCGGLLDTHW